MKDRELIHVQTVCLGLPQRAALFKLFYLTQLQTLLLSSSDHSDINLNLQF